jgi:hypothetical protein
MFTVKSDDEGDFSMAKHTEIKLSTILGHIIPATALMQANVRHKAHLKNTS